TEHLAGSAGESLDEWERTNEELKKKVLAGDDASFFKLLARDPRLIRSPLTVIRIVNWRSDIFRYAQYYRFKEPVHSSSPASIAAKERMSAAKMNLDRFGRVHASFCDERGKK